MNWDLAQLMKEALEANKHIFKSYLRDDPEATKNLDPDPNIVKYIRDSLHNIKGISIYDSISRSEFDEWKNSDISDVGHREDGMQMLLTEDKVSKKLDFHGMKITLYGDLYGELENMADAKFYISYPVLDGNILKTLGEVCIISPYIDEDNRGLGLGTFLYMIIMWTCYKRYGVKYAATHAATFTGGTSHHADRVYNSLNRAGILSPVRDTLNHKEYLSAIGRDKVRAEALAENQKIDGYSISDIEMEISELIYFKYTKKEAETTLENAIKIINDPEEYSIKNGGRLKLKHFVEAAEEARSNSIEDLKLRLERVKSDLEDTEKNLKSLYEKKAKIGIEIKSELSPEEVVSSMEKERDNYKDNINRNNENQSEGDGMDHYQINHNALIDYFKMFAEHHPELCDKDGNLNIKYNNAKVNIV